MPGDPLQQHIAITTDILEAAGLFKEAVASAKADLADATRTLKGARQEALKSDTGTVPQELVDRQERARAELSRLQGVAHESDLVQQLSRQRQRSAWEEYLNRKRELAEEDAIRKDYTRYESRSRGIRDRTDRLLERLSDRAGRGITRGEARVANYVKSLEGVHEADAAVRREALARMATSGMRLLGVAPQVSTAIAAAATGAITSAAGAASLGGAAGFAVGRFIAGEYQRDTSGVAAMGEMQSLVGSSLYGAFRGAARFGGSGSDAEKYLDLTNKASATFNVMLRADPIDNLRQSLGLSASADTIRKREGLQNHAEKLQAFGMRFGRAALAKMEDGTMFDQQVTNYWLNRLGLAGAFQGGVDLGPTGAFARLGRARNFVGTAAEGVFHLATGTFTDWLSQETEAKIRQLQDGTMKAKEQAQDSRLLSWQKDVSNAVHRMRANERARHDRDIEKDRVSRFNSWAMM